MRNTIKEKSGISIPIYFEVIENRTLYSPTAFDSDYYWIYQLKVGIGSMQDISSQIESSRFFDSNLVGPVYDSLSLYKLPGFWKKTDSGYEFFPAREAWAESTKIEIYTKEGLIKVDLSHL